MTDTTISRTEMIGTIHTETLVGTSDADMIAAFATDDVEAVVTWNPLLSEIEAQANATKVFNSADISGEIIDIMMVNTQTLADNPAFGKALTGGHITLAATVATEPVARGIGESEASVLMHGPTYMANPLACAAGAASLDQLSRRDWRAEVHAIAQQMAHELAPARNLPGVADVRVLGAIGVIEMENWVDPSIAHRKAPETGVWLRPFARNIYCMPPYIISPDELSKVTAAMVALARES